MKYSAAHMYWPSLPFCIGVVVHIYEAPVQSHCAQTVVAIVSDRRNDEPEEADQDGEKVAEGGGLGQEENHGGCREGGERRVVLGREFAGAREQRPRVRVHGRREAVHGAAEVPDQWHLPGAAADVGGGVRAAG